jgi:CRP-like cAMP-binding protein
LLALLPARDRLGLLESCEPVDLTLQQVLDEPGVATRHVYFPVTGFISLVTLVEDRPGIEVGLIGSEGLLGSHIVLGVASSPIRALVQGAGTAWRMPVRAFRAELARRSALRRQLSRYIYVLMAQQAGAAACLRFHLTAPRLARWLLMSQDRAGSSHFHITQEFIAYMLGMRRVGITTAAAALQRSGLIAYQRGEMTVLDRPGLEALACSCYAKDRLIYADVLG